MNRNRKLFQSQNGYSMIEILVALVIVPFGLLGVAKLQSNVMVAGAETKTRSEALYAAEKKIEELRTFANTTSYSTINSGNDNIAASSGSNAILSRTWSVTDSASPNYKTVVVDVGWTGSNSQANSVSLTSYVSMANPVASGQLVLNDSMTLVPPGPDPVANPDPGANPDPAPAPDPVAGVDPLPDPDPAAEPNPPTYTITVSGLISYAGNGNKDWSVSINGSVCDSGSNSSSYNCVISGIPWADAPTLNVSLTSSGTICGSSAVNQSFSNSSNVGALDFTHAQNAARCS